MEFLNLLYFSCRMQKYGFAVVNIFGDNTKNTIRGIWVWRGTGLIFDLSPDLQVDYESYDWTKLDHSAPETKKMIAEYFPGDVACNGEVPANCCVFKWTRFLLAC